MQVTTTEPITAWDAEAVAGFAAGGADILVLARRPLDYPDPPIRAGLVNDYRSEVTADTARQRVTAGLRELAIDSEPLLDDVTGLVTAFLSQFGQTRASLRIEMVQEQTCPKFHCDNVHVRMVTTYLGPTTEYRFAGKDAPHAAPLYGLVFLKGHKHPTHRDAVHHRSPEVPAGEKRLCVVIDY